MRCQGIGAGPSVDVINIREELRDTRRGTAVVPLIEIEAVARVLLAVWAAAAAYSGGGVIHRSAGAEEE